jgi:hypothetical protein
MPTKPPEKSDMRIPPIGGYTIQKDFWPPRVVWGREQGWLNVRDPWGTWHSIPSKEAPSGYVKLAMKAKGR